ncbi:MAG: diaminopimelate epimerase [Gemmatimonadetes bacterium]|nr:diaminopimelate epimerase [Gemmatimonadota bacterium]
MSVVFFKLTGSGNDFVMVDGRSTTPTDWPVERIRAICDRRDGIGADGFVILTPVGPDAVEMTFYNSDGSAAPMCGNAALCSTRLAAHLEMADPAGMTLVTGAGSFRTRCVGEGHMAELNLPDTDVPVETGIPPLAGEGWVRLGRVGVPHLVVMTEDVAAVDIPTRGRELRFHERAGVGGANANFVSRTSRSTGSGTSKVDEPQWAVRTYERGVEAETMACGTGTVTAALAIAALGLDQLPLRFRTESGRLLAVNATIEGSRATQIWLCGEGRLVARGVWLDV